MIIPEYFGVRISMGGRQVSDERDLRVWFESHHFGRKGGFKFKEYETSKAVTAASLATVAGQGW